MILKKYKGNTQFICVNHKRRRNPKEKPWFGKITKFLLVSQISSHNQNNNNN